MFSTQRLFREASQNVNVPWLLYPQQPSNNSFISLICPKATTSYSGPLYTLGIWCRRVHQSRATNLARLYKNNPQVMPQKTASCRVALFYATLLHCWNTWLWQWPFLSTAGLEIVSTKISNSSREEKEDSNPNGIVSKSSISVSLLSRNKFYPSLVGGSL